ncbi:MAG: CoA transferase [Pseudomonadota bacterium]
MSDSPAAPFGPLAGLRALEMGQLLAGPFCGQLLGDFGAEVIKLEQPGRGDPMRDWGREKANGESLWWPVVSRNKKCITLNARERAGQELILSLVEKSDFLVENFRPGTLERWNLSYDALKAVNPGLILVRVTGYGQSGPYAARAGYGAIGEAMGGLRYVVGSPDRPPSRMGISIGDTLAATFACVGALSALHHRHVTGEGQVVDSAIYEAVLNVMESLISEFDATGFVRERTGAILPNVAPSNVYPTSDGEHLIAANQDSVFTRLSAAMGRPELAEDERYVSHNARGEHQEELDNLIADWTRTLDGKSLEDLLNEHSVPNGRIYRAPEMLEDAHFKARDAIIRLAHPSFGEIAMQNVAPKLSATPGGIRFAGAALGEHNDEVYGDLLGLDAQRRSALQADGII